MHINAISALRKRDHPPSPDNCIDKSAPIAATGNGLPPDDQEDVGVDADEASDTDSLSNDAFTGKASKPNKPGIKETGTQRLPLGVR